MKSDSNTSRRAVTTAYEADLLFAPRIKRLLNLLIDLTFLQLLQQYVTGYFFQWLTNRINPDYFVGVAGAQQRLEFTTHWWLYIYLTGAISLLFYYFVMEYFCSGKTIGKYFTGTQAVTVEGNTMSLKNAIIRSLIRLIPLEPLSGFSTLTWHDKWSHTRVISLK